MAGRGRGRGVAARAFPLTGVRKRWSAADEHSDSHPVHAAPFRKAGPYLETSPSNGRDSNMHVIIPSMPNWTLY